MNGINQVNQLLFAQLEKLSDPKCDLEVEVKRSEAMAKVSSNIIKSAELSVRAAEITGDNTILTRTLALESK